VKRDACNEYGVTCTPYNVTLISTSTCHSTMADQDNSDERAANVKPTPSSAPRKVWKGNKDFPDLNELHLNNYVKLATRKNVWFYRDRCGVNRGPAPLPTMRDAWVNGLIDQNTLVWGQGMVDFLPIKNVRTLMGQIRTWDGAFYPAHEYWRTQPAHKPLRQFSHICVHIWM
jgi:hypothetical protein